MIKPLVLIIMDGWGLAPPGPGNAISLSKLNHFPKYWISYPHTELTASGQSVGLPLGEDGNTETGHLNLGAGRVVYQDLPRINMSIADGSYFQNEALLSAFKFAESHKSNIHIMGLVGDGGVHSSIEHLHALLDLAKQQQCTNNVFIHAITDGRDSPPTAGIRYVDELEKVCQAKGVGKIATVMGRYYAMDRDRRWERIEKAYIALTENISNVAPSAQQAIEASYAKNITDEFLDPTIILDPDNKPLPRITNYDAVIFFNFRIDRPRELTKAFVLSDFETHTGTTQTFDPYAVKYFKKHVVEEDSRLKPFTRKIVLPHLLFVTMTEYERELPCLVAFPPQRITNPLGSIFAELGQRQLRMAETEKERFIGYYFNGMRELPYPGEDRLIVPSPKVPTYDLKPEMSAYELTEKLLDRLSIGVYSFILINFANADMVGHTGNIPSAIRAVETIDACLGKIIPAILALDGTCAITADHGNVEEMLGPNGEVDTEHSTFPVPFVIIDHMFDNYPQVLPKGKLADVATTLLAMRKISVPAILTGRNLLVDALKK